MLLLKNYKDGYDLLFKDEFLNNFDLHMGMKEVNKKIRKLNTNEL